MKEGYVVFVVSVRPHRQPKHDPLPLDDLDGNGLRLVDLVRERLEEYVDRAVPERRRRFESAYAFASLPTWGDGRVFVVGESGPYGRRGRLKNIDAGDEHPISVNDAALLPLHAGLVTFPDARYALLFCERRGSSTLRSELEEAVLRPVARARKLTLTIETHVDFEEWERFLANSRVASVRAVYPSRREEDYQPNVAESADLTLSAGGGLAHRVGTGLIQNALAAVRHRGSPDPAAVLVGDLRPRREDDYGAPRVSLTATDGDVQRTVKFSEDGVPQWVYVTNGRLTSREARGTWEAAASTLIRPYLAD